MSEELSDFVITKTTTETLGIKATSLAEANKAALAGGGDAITASTNIVVRPRPVSHVASMLPGSRGGDAEVTTSPAKTTVNRPGGK